MNFLPPPSAGNGTITRECPSAARGGGRAADTANEGENHDGNEKSDGSLCRPDSVLDDSRNWLSAGEVDEHLDVGQDEDKGNKEEKPAKSIDKDGGYHGLGDLGRGFVDFFAHRNDHSSR